MVILTSIFAYHNIQLFLRLMIYFFMWSLVMVFRFLHRKKTRKRMDERTKYMMKHTEKDKDGKYPWEIKDND